MLGLLKSAGLSVFIDLRAIDTLNENVIGGRGIQSFLQKAKILSDKVKILIWCVIIILSPFTFDTFFVKLGSTTWEKIFRIADV